ncbi:MAG: hypothetical protein ACLQJR_00515 [Stellaceae bacterium]
MSTSTRATTFRWQESLRKSVPASMAELLNALKRLWAEAAALAENAYVAIQQHSFEPYWTFRAKINEHAALVAVIRGRIQQLTALRSRQAGIVTEAVNREEEEIVILTVKACLKFCFALSANPWLPIGARETFIHEISALTQARTVLEKAPQDKLPSGLLDDLDTARMILEEIIDKSPSLTSFDRRRPAATEETAEAPAEAQTLSPA